MTRAKRILLLGLGVGLVPSPLLAEHTKTTHSKPAGEVVAAKPTPSAVYHAPFGYFQTHWRAYPTVTDVLPEPGPKGPVTSSQLLRNTPEEKTPVVSREPSTSENTPKPMPRTAEPVRQATAVPTAPPTTTAKQPVRPERGFASLRSPTDAPIATSQATPIPAPPIPPPPGARTPVIDPGVRPVRGDDDVVRPEWPTLPAPRK